MKISFFFFYYVSRQKQTNRKYKIKFGGANFTHDCGKYYFDYSDITICSEQ